MERQMTLTEKAPHHATPPPLPCQEEVNEDALFLHLLLLPLLLPFLLLLKSFFLYNRMHFRRVTSAEAAFAPHTLP